MDGNDPPPNIDTMMLDDDDGALEDFDAAVKGLESGKKFKDGLYRKLHVYKTSLYFSIDDPESAAGKKFIRNKFATWLSQVKDSHVLNGKPIIVSTMEGKVMDVASLPTDGHVFANLVGWKKTKDVSVNNVFMYVYLTMHVNFASLKHLVIDHLKESLIVMKRNNSLGDKATEMAVLGWVSAMLPDLHLMCLQSMFNQKVKRVAKKCDPDELKKFGIEADERGEIFLTHGSVSGMSKTFGPVTNNRVVVVECPRPKVGFYMRHLQEIIDKAAWSPDLQKVKFVPFAMKNKDANPEVFAKMIVRNSKENDKKTYFQILGVALSWFTMKVQKRMIAACPSITHVDMTDLSAKQGRWRVYCDKENEDEVAKWLENELKEFYYDHSGDESEPVEGFEQPRLVAKASKIPPSQMEELVEACNAVFTEDLDKFPELVSTRRGSPQGAAVRGAWTSQPPVLAPPPPTPPVQPIPRHIPMSTTSPTLDSSVTRSVADLRNQLAEQRAWRDKLDAEQTENARKQKSMMDDISKLQKVVAEQSRKIEEQYDFLKDLTKGQAAIDKSLARNETETKDRFETTSSEIKTMMTILVGLDSKIGNITSILPHVASKSLESPTTPPRVVRGTGAMETNSDDEDLSADTYTLALNAVESRVHQPTTIPPSGDQKRPPHSSPAKRTLRSATRKSARTYQQVDVSYPSGNQSYSSHGSGTPTCADSAEWWAGADDSQPENLAAIDTFPERLGDRCQPLEDDQVRVLFGNINGLQLGDRGHRLRQIFREIHMLNAHHTGLVEVNTNTKHSTASKLLFDAAKEEFTHSVLTPATSRTECSSLYKPGGVLSVSNDSFVSRLIDTGSDEMGRWSFKRYNGKEGKVITVITVYQVCSRPTNEVGNTAYHQQVQQMAQESIQQDTTIPAPQPRLRFRQDLLRLLLVFRRNGDSIILMGDFNEDIGDHASKLQSLFQDDRLQLIDIIGQHHPSTLTLPTYIRGSKRLDFILVSSELVSAVRRCGYLPFHRHFRSDHRFAFIDFDHHLLLGTNDPQLASPMFREFVSKDPKQVEKYLLEKYQLLQDQNFFPRLQHLDDSATPDHDLAERLDACWVHASLVAARRCKKRRREWWSIPLHQALEEKSLLQTHLTGLRTGNDLSASISQRILKFNLPPIQFPSSIAETNAALKAVQRRIKTIRETSKSVREQSLIDQARQAKFTGRRKSDADILEQLRKKELQAERWRKIGFLQGKQRSSQFTNVEVPQSWPRTQAAFLHPDRPIENPKLCLNWRTVEDPSEMEFYIQMRNRLHFGQAQGTPFTVGTLCDDIDWSASSSRAEDILLGRYRADPLEYRSMEDDEFESPQAELLQTFLDSCQRSPSQLAQPMTLPEISVDELSGRIRVWNERTTTSPSGLHLGHLKSMTARVSAPPYLPMMRVKG